MTVLSSSPAGVESQVAENSISIQKKINELKAGTFGTALGYSRFPTDCFKNRFFESFISGFKSLDNGSIKAFTQLQHDMLDELIAGNNFQVTSADVNCGSGKTTLTIGATLGLLREEDRIIVVTRSNRNSTPLLSQLEHLARTFSNGKARVGTYSRPHNVADFVCGHDILITSCFHFCDVVRATMRQFDMVSLNGTFCALPKVYVIFDESHQLFPSMPRRSLNEFFCGARPGSDDAMFRFSRWKVLEDVKMIYKRRAALLLNTEGRSGNNTIKEALRYGLESFTSMIYRGLEYLEAHRRSGLHQCIFLSAGGEFVPNSGYAPSSAVIEEMLRSWFDCPVSKLISSGANIDSYRQTKVFRIFRSGAEQIGGVSNDGYPLIYETMMEIAFNWMIEGRLLFIMRRSQVDAFCDLLNERVKEHGEYFSYTTDKEYWNSTDRFGKPKYNIVICREDELNDLEGVNLNGIKAVYLFSVGRVQDLLAKLQGVGRVGRIGQGRTYTFVMIDCASRRNAKIEASTEEALLGVLSSNSTHKPHIMDVYGRKVLSESLTDIPVFRPESVAAYCSPGIEKLRNLMRSIREANRPQVCKSLQYDCKRSKYWCPHLERGYRCSWYHPQPEDFISPRVLDASYFNVRYCQKGLFLTQCGGGVVKRCGSEYNAPIAPWTVKSAVVARESGTKDSISASRYDELFPKLGADLPVLGPVPEEKSDSESTTGMLHPEPSIPYRASDEVNRSQRRNEFRARPVCRFALSKRCRYFNAGERCPFRHPEIAEDRVTDSELKEVSRNFSNKRDYNTRSNPNSFSKASNHSFHQQLKAPQKSISLVKDKSITTEKDSESDGWIKCHRPRRDIATAEKHCTSSTSIPASNYFSALNFIDSVEVCASKDDHSNSESVVINSNVKSLADDVQGDLINPASPITSSAKSANGLAVEYVTAFLSEIGKSDSLDFHGFGSEVSASALVRAVMESDHDCVAERTWYYNDWFGTVLKRITKSNICAQEMVLREVERHYRLCQFPYLETCHGSEPLLSLTFRALFDANIIEMDAFFMWCENGDTEATDKDKLRALFQTASFTSYLQEIDRYSEDSDEEVEIGDDVCYLLKDNISVINLESPLEEVKTAKALKKERRLARVQSRGQ